MKRLVLAAAAAAGFMAYREWKKSEQTRDVWDEATDTVEKN